MYRLPLFLVIVASIAACKMEERRVPDDEFMPGYEIKIPKDLPKTEQVMGKDGVLSESKIDAHKIYKDQHREGWQECFWGYRWNKIKLSEPKQLPAGGFANVPERARHDGYEECRTMLLRNGNK